MNETERKAYLEQFNRRTHVLGRIVSAITLVLLVGAPFLIGTFLGAMPDMGAVAKGFLSVGLVWTVSSVAEFLIYTPMLGAGGGYLAFITGNLINMKIPCAVNARDIVGTKTGTAAASRWQRLRMAVRCSSAISSWAAARTAATASSTRCRSAAASAPWLPTRPSSRTPASSSITPC